MESAAAAVDGRPYEKISEVLNRVIEGGSIEDAPCILDATRKVDLQPASVERALDRLQHYIDHECPFPSVAELLRQPSKTTRMAAALRAIVSNQVKQTSLGPKQQWFHMCRESRRDVRTALLLHEIMRQQHSRGAVPPLPLELWLLVADFACY